MALAPLARTLVLREGSLSGTPTIVVEVPDRSLSLPPDTNAPTPPANGGGTSTATNGLVADFSSADHSSMLALF